MKIRHASWLFLLSFLSLPSALSAALVISWPSAPSSVNGGTSYTVTARATSSNSWPELYLYKNGSLVGNSSAQSVINVSTTQTDSGGQSIAYFAEAFDSLDHHTTSSISVTIVQTTTPTTFSFSNLSYTYDGSTKTASVSPSPGGATYTSDLTKGPGVGSYTVSATATGSYTGSGSATLTINKADQAAISLSAATTSQAYGSSQTISVSGGSGTGTISPYIAGQSSAGNATLVGNTLTANASSGWVDLQGTRNADSNYNVAYATPVRVNFTTAPATFTFSNLTYTYDGTAKTATVAPSPAGATYSADLTKGPGAGSYTVTATANGNYSGSGSATLAINKAGQTITFTNPGSQTPGPHALSASASSGLAVSFAVISGPGTLSGNTLTVSSVGSVTVAASQAGDANFNAASNVSQTFAVTNVAPAGLSATGGTITYGQTFSTTLHATDANSDLVTLHLVVASVAFNAGANNWEGSSTDGWKWRHFRSDSVSGGNATITVPVTDGNYGTPSPLPVGTYRITINAQDSLPNYSYDPSSTLATLIVAPATPTGTFANRTRIAGVSNTYTVVAGDLDAAFAGPGGAVTPTGTVTYSIVGPGTTVSVGTVLTSATYTIRASYPGDGNYNATTKDATWIVTPDGDGDGISNVIETALGTNPSTANATDSGAASSLKVHQPN